MLTFDSPSLTSQWKEGQLLRRTQVAIPDVDKIGKIVSIVAALKTKMFDYVGKKTTT